MSLPMPQETGCTRIVIDLADPPLSEGVTNGIVSLIAATREVEYVEERDAYVVGPPL